MQAIEQRATAFGLLSCRRSTSHASATEAPATPETIAMERRGEVDQRARIIWVDITELFDHFSRASHPTGVSRVVLKLADALIADPGPVFRMARPLFWHPLRGRPLTCEDARLSPLSAFFPQLSALYSGAGLPRPSGVSRPRKAIATSLPRLVRYRLFPADNGVVLFDRWARQQGIRLVEADLAEGDSLFMPGSFWLGRYATRLVDLADAANIPITALIHDMLLLSHPEWLPGRHSHQFRNACERLLPRCAAIVCNSCHTRAELAKYVSLPPQLPVHTCRLADEAFADSSTAPPPATSDLLLKRYVLCVSSIVPRKNHRLLIEAWRALWGELGPSTPLLVLVGGGTLDADAAPTADREMQESGRIIRLEGVDDRTLEALYRHAWMTAYTSLGEGYGLPVAEALSRGKVCLAASVGGIREISADLIDFIDPRDPQSLAKKIKSYVLNPPSLAAREAEIKSRYRSTSWSETARTVRSALENAVVHF